MGAMIHLPYERGGCRPSSILTAPDEARHHWLTDMDEVGDVTCPYCREFINNPGRITLETIIATAARGLETLRAEREAAFRENVTDLRELVAHLARVMEL